MGDEEEDDEEGDEENAVNIYLFILIKFNI